MAQMLFLWREECFNADEPGSSDNILNIRHNILRIFRFLLFEAHSSKHVMVREVKGEDMNSNNDAANCCFHG